MFPRYPIYVISKGRWESRLTVRQLELMECPYKLVVEPQEYDKYAFFVDPKNILTLPFSNLGQGSIPARNWVWDHAQENGAERHWILDDNIRSFFFINRNVYIWALTPAIFEMAEDFVDRYENIGQAGFQYFMFVKRKAKFAPFDLNTRIYSCILNKTDLSFRWRGRYNEDTDLSIRILKAGWCTVLFYALIADKMTTMTMKGGNTEELYKDDGRKKMAESLVEQHPDITKVVWKWNRWQHSVNYTGFTQRLVPKPEWYKIPPGVNNYGMKLVVDEEETADSRSRTVA
jgi:hypothetical protein